MRLFGLLILAVLLAACSGGDDANEPQATVSVTAVSTPRPGTTAVPGQTAVPPITLDSFHPVLQLKGVFRPPQTTVPTTTFEVPARPKSEFAAWNGVSVVVYDTATGQAHDFGPGRLAQPAFGEGQFVYTSADNEIFTVDLETMEATQVATGILAYFLGDHHIVVNPGNNNFYALDLENDNKRVDLSTIREPVLKSMVSQRWGGGFQGKWQDDRFVLRLAENPLEVCESTGPEQRACLAETGSKWLVEDVWAQQVLLAFQANRVEPAGPAEVVIATTPVCYEAGWITNCFEILAKLENQTSGTGTQAAVEGTTNIFLVDLTSGEATFVATATYNASTGQWPMNWPLVANEKFVAWTESYCGQPQGLTRVYNRETGEITELNRADWLVLSGDRLGLGETGATMILDALSLEYLAVLPELSSVSWSSDLRYAAVAQSIGRGNVCE